MVEKKQIPGIEKYSAFPHIEQAYRHHFNDAFRVLSHPTMSEDIRTRAQGLSIAYASARTEQHFSLEDQIKAMSARILKAGDEIITERGWNPAPDGANFAWQLRGTNSKNATSLRLSARTGKPVDFLKIQLGKYRGQHITIAEFSDIPDLWAGASQEQSIRELMLDFFIDFSKRLGFISSEHDLYQLPQVKKSSNREANDLKVRRPDQPFLAGFIDFRDYNRKIMSRRETIEENTPENIELKRAIDEFLDKRRELFGDLLDNQLSSDSDPRPHPEIVIRIDLYHQ